MQISLGHGYKVRLGNYEMDDVNAHLTMNHHDLGFTDEEWAEKMSDEGVDTGVALLHAAVKDHLTTLLYDEFDELEPYIVEPEETFVPLWLEDHAPKKKRGS